MQPASALSPAVINALPCDKIDRPIIVISSRRKFHEIL